MIGGTPPSDRSSRVTWPGDCGEAPPRRRAGAPGAGGVPHRRGAPHRRRAGPSRGDAGDDVGPPGRRRDPDHDRHRRAAVRVPGRGEAGRGARRLLGSRCRSGRPRRRGLHRRVHRLPAPAGRSPGARGRRRAGPARLVAASGPARGRVRAHQRAHARRRAARGDRSTWSSPTCRSSHCAPWPPRCVACATPSAEFVLLVKPQFEAGPARVGRGGIVRDPEVHAAVLGEVADRAGRRRSVRHGGGRIADQGGRGQPRVPRAGRPHRTRAPGAARSRRSPGPRRRHEGRHPSPPRARRGDRPRPRRCSLARRARCRRRAAEDRGRARRPARARGRPRDRSPTASTSCCRSAATARCCARSTRRTKPGSRCSA